MSSKLPVEPCGFSTHRKQMGWMRDCAAAAARRGSRPSQRRSLELGCSNRATDHASTDRSTQFTFGNRRRQRVFPLVAGAHVNRKQRQPSEPTGKTDPSRLFIHWNQAAHHAHHRARPPNIPHRARVAGTQHPSESSRIPTGPRPCLSSSLDCTTHTHTPRTQR